MTCHASFLGKTAGISLFLLLTGLVFTGSAMAQRPGANRGGKDMPRENLSGSGKIAQIGPGVIGVVGEGGEQWMVKLPTKIDEFAISGTADRGFLRAGMWVEFAAIVGKRGQVNDPVKELIIFTPRPGYEVGIGPNTPAVGNAGAAGELFNSPAPEEKPKKAPKPTAPEEPTELRIAAEITKVGRKGEITVGAGGIAVKADVAEDAKIKVDVADMSYVSVGDKVEFQGWYYTAVKNQVYATSLTITAAQKFTDGKKTKVKPMPKTTDATDEAKGDDKEKGEKADGEKEAKTKEKTAEKAAEKTAEKKDE